MCRRGTQTHPYSASVASESSFLCALCVPTSAPSAVILFLRFFSAVLRLLCVNLFTCGGRLRFARSSSNPLPYEIHNRLRGSPRKKNLGDPALLQRRNIRF